LAQSLLPGRRYAAYAAVVAPSPPSIWTFLSGLLAASTVPFENPVVAPAKPALGAVVIMADVSLGA
jgi:hypothetical protein